MAPPVSDYLGATLIGDDTELLLDPDDTELLVDTLDDGIDEILAVLEDIDDGEPGDRDAVAVQLDALTRLRDAIHSVVVRVDESPSDPIQV